MSGQINHNNTSITPEDLEGRAKLLSSKIKQIKNYLPQKIKTLSKEIHRLSVEISSKATERDNLKKEMSSKESELDNLRNNKLIKYKQIVLIKTLLENYLSKEPQLIRDATNNTHTKLSNMIQSTQLIVNEQNMLLYLNLYVSELIEQWEKRSTNLLSLGNNTKKELDLERMNNISMEYRGLNKIKELDMKRSFNDGNMPVVIMHRQKQPIITDVSTEKLPLNGSETSSSVLQEASLPEEVSKLIKEYQDFIQGQLRLLLSYMVEDVKDLNGIAPLEYQQLLTLKNVLEKHLSQEPQLIEAAVISTESQFKLFIEAAKSKPDYKKFIELTPNLAYLAIYSYELINQWGKHYTKESVASRRFAIECEELRAISQNEVADLVKNIIDQVSIKEIPPITNLVTPPSTATNDAKDADPKLGVHFPLDLFDLSTLRSPVKNVTQASINHPKEQTTTTKVQGKPEKSRRHLYQLQEKLAPPKTQSSSNNSDLAPTTVTVPTAEIRKHRVNFNKLPFSLPRKRRVLPVHLPMQTYDTRSEDQKQKIVPPAIDKQPQTPSSNNDAIQQPPALQQQNRWKDVLRSTLRVNNPSNTVHPDNPETASKQTTPLTKQQRIRTIYVTEADPDITNTEKEMKQQPKQSSPN